MMVAVVTITFILDTCWWKTRAILVVRNLESWNIKSVISLAWVIESRDGGTGE